MVKHRFPLDNYYILYISYGLEYFWKSSDCGTLNAKLAQTKP